jgi:hypothetical protein
LEKARPGYQKHCDIMMGGVGEGGTPGFGIGGTGAGFLIGGTGISGGIGPGVGCGVSAGCGGTGTSPGAMLPVGAECLSLLMIGFPFARFKVGCE